VFEQEAVLLEGLGQVVRLVPVPHPAPRDQIGAGRDRGRRVELEERELLDDGSQLSRSVGVEQLRPDGDPPSLLACERADGCGHDAVCPGAELRSRPMLAERRR